MNLILDFRIFPIYKYDYSLHKIGTSFNTSNSLFALKLWKIMIGREGGGLLLGFARLLLWSFWGGGQVRTRGNGGIALGKLFHILHNKDSVIVCWYSYRFTSNILLRSTVLWLKYCQYSVKHYPINQSIL